MRESRVDNIEHVNWRGPASAGWLSYLIITSHCHQSQSRLETWFQPFAHLVAVTRASSELWGAWYQWQLNMDLLRVSLVLHWATVSYGVVWWWWAGPTQQSGFWWVHRHQVWWWWWRNEERPVLHCLSPHTDWLVVYSGPCTELHQVIPPPPPH